MVEEVVEVPSKTAVRAPARSLTDFSAAALPLPQIETAKLPRRPTGIGELDRLLGGGFVPGQVTLVAGPPGIGKSTLMLHTAEKLSRDGKVLYVSGEESPSQVSSRAKRLGISAERIYLQAETDLVKVLAAAKEHEPKVLIIDSIQTLAHPEFPGSPGSVGQVRECAAELLRAVKKSGAVLILLGHVTKDGGVAGPKVLEHIVDTVLQFDAEPHQQLRILRVQKNRFGPTAEIGIFEMGERGLREVSDASAFFLEEMGAKPVAGRAVSVALEGTRPILAEVQALVTPTKYPLPRRMATGVDLNRVLVLVAALEKHLKIRFESQDIFVNIAGGLRLRDPAIDLAVCMALVSSARDAALPSDWVFVGEVGLLGRLGRVSSTAQRLKTAGRVGFKTALVPGRAVADLEREGGIGKIKTRGAESLAAAASAAFGGNL